MVVGRDFCWTRARKRKTGGMSRAAAACLLGWKARERLSLSLTRPRSHGTSSSRKKHTNISVRPFFAGDI